ncbi:hypothetical protein [Aquimarina sp. AU119]|uniref:hypothetical protein n=1 Tax=Aquimarina sp. AU119 TaxID=2108528 RepID=UPI00135732C9|nr:hypothetical protein [Aquimarina sp. AU119]
MTKKITVENEKKEYISKAVFNLGSKKDGSAKNSYKVGDKILLTEKQAEILTKENKI